MFVSKTLFLLRTSVEDTHVSQVVRVGNLRRDFHVFGVLRNDTKLYPNCGASKIRNATQKIVMGFFDLRRVHWKDGGYSVRHKTRGYRMPDASQGEQLRPAELRRRMLARANEIRGRLGLPPIGEEMFDIARPLYGKALRQEL
jgi:hypothetical protein